MKLGLNRSCTFAIVWTSFVSMTPARAEIRRVDTDAPAGGDGSTWGLAFRYVQDALNVAAAGDEIRVAEGIYRPDERSDWPADGTGDRQAAFQLIDGVAVRGGYAGFGAADPDLRDTQTFRTVLSGDLGQDDGADFANNGENSYHVLVGTGTDATAVLDGFVIRAGHANGSALQKTNRGAGMFSAGGSPTLIDCTFTGNRADYGGGIGNWQGSNPTLTNCRFTANSAVESGGAIHNYSSSPTLAGCSLYANAANVNGGGLFNAGAELTLEDCIFGGNAASNGAGIYNQDSNLVLTNCLFSGNAAASFGGGILSYTIATGSALTLTNCTFSENSAMFGGGMSNDYDTRAGLTNCTLYGNHDDGGADESAQIDGGILRIDFSCIQGWTGAVGGIGNIAADPLFEDADGADDEEGTEDDDPRLQDGSPCVNAGSNYAALLPTLDLEGNQRIRMCRVDMGAYESPYSPPLVDCNTNGEPDDCDIYEATSRDCNWNHIPDDCEPGAGEDCNNNTVPDFCDIFEGTSEDCNGNTVPDECESFGPVLYVDGSAAGDNSGSDWTNALTDLQGALCLTAGSARAIGEVRVAQGVYKPDRSTGERSATFQLLSGVVIYGGFPSGGGDGTFQARAPSVYVTALSGDIGVEGDPSDNCYHVVSAGGTDATAWLDGLTITGGNADGDDADAFGGAMYIAAGSPTVTGCAFTGNRADCGAGIYNFESSPALTNCVFVGNRAGGSCDGGAIYNAENSNPTLTNCTLVANYAGRFGGGIMNFSGSPTVTNCIFWNNTDGGGPDESAQINVVAGVLTINHTCLQGWTGLLGGTGNTAASPSLIDTLGPDGQPGTNDEDLRLASDSPCIDAGDNGALPPDGADLDDDANTTERVPYDLDGNARFVDDPDTIDTGVADPPDYVEVVDLGAYEYQAGPVCVCGDLNGDGFVNLEDFATFATCFALSFPVLDCDATEFVCSDMEVNGQIDLNDFATFAVLFAQPASGSPPDCVAPLPGD